MSGLSAALIFYPLAVSITQYLTAIGAAFGDSVSEYQSIYDAVTSVYVIRLACHLGLIAKVFLFEEADKAFEALRKLQEVGKIVVEV